MLMFQFSDPEFLTDLKALEAETTDLIRRLLEMVGIEVIAHLRSLTGEMRPPVRKGEGERQAHPGHWADITGALANAYRWEIEMHGDGVSLALINSMDYAGYLDAKDGYFVLRGVTDPGGPVALALAAAIQRVAPGWELRYG